MSLDASFVNTNCTFAIHHRTPPTLGIEILPGGFLVRESTRGGADGRRVIASAEELIDFVRGWAETS